MTVQRAVDEGTGPRSGLRFGNPYKLDIREYRIARHLVRGEAHGGHRQRSGIGDCRIRHSERVFGIGRRVAAFLAVRNHAVVIVGVWPLRNVATDDRHHTTPRIIARITFSPGFHRATRELRLQRARLEVVANFGARAHTVNCARNCATVAHVPRMGLSIAEPIANEPATVKGHGRVGS